MASADYLRRLEAIQMAKTEAIEAKETKSFRRPLQVVGAITGAIAFFFVLKAAALSSSDAALAGPLVTDADFGAMVFHWFAGADPITQTLAAAIRPSMAVSTF